MAGFLASSEMNPNLLADRIQPLVSKTLWLEQIKAGGLIILLSVGVTVVLYFIVDKTLGCRVSDEVEDQGLDLTEHGEEGYTH
jgi:Amt family ammonium transporter